MLYPRVGDGKCAKIIDNLWLCDLKTARDADTLNPNSLTIVDASATPLPKRIKEKYNSKGITYRRIDINFYDVPFDSKSRLLTQDRFIEIVKRGAELINNALKSSDDANVIVHCHAGINRSSASIAAYLIIYKMMDHEDVIELIRTANREQRNMPALTNPDFVAALKLLVPATFGSKHRNT